MDKESKVYVSGHLGLVGSAICRKLKNEGYKNISVRTSKELDLRDQKATEEFFKSEKPEYVFNCAAKVGGIYANNTYKANFIYDNLQIQTNIIHFSYESRVKKLLNFGSNCMYPKNCSQPILEESLLTGEIEPTNDAYAISKIAGLKMCQSYNTQHKTNFITAIPVSLFGPNDNYDENDSHLTAALIRKFHHAKVNDEKFVELWGSGTPMREIMYVDNISDACLFLMRSYNSSEPINVGSGKEWRVKDLAELISDIVGFSGEIELDLSKPDGVSRKILDSSKINRLGWKPKIDVEEGLKKTYEDFVDSRMNT